MPTNVHPFPSPAETHLQQVTDLFLAPSASERYFRLQLEESEQADEIADRIAEVVHDVDGLVKIADRKQQATVRFLSRHALRMTDDRWQRAATQAAITQCAEWMKGEGGDTFRHCSDEHLVAMATYLAPRVLRAYLGITEGTSPMTPGRYLEIRGQR